ncbi:MAG TPA: NUDIX domain-containing protein [Chlamydiales bacterium]|nr:NUDIX domain-containing protein [Chlamydiales bacterium]
MFKKWIKIIFVFVVVGAGLLFMKKENDYRIVKKQKIQKTTVSASGIVEVYDNDKFLGVILIDQVKEPYGKKLPSGEIEYGESTEKAILRITQNLTGLKELTLKQFHVYSDPRRHYQDHLIDIAYIIKAQYTPEIADLIHPIDRLENMQLLYDHSVILQDYLAFYNQTLREKEVVDQQEIVDQKPIEGEAESQEETSSI